MGVIHCNYNYNEFTCVQDATNCNCDYVLGLATTLMRPYAPVASWLSRMVQVQS